MKANLEIPWMHPWFNIVHGAYLDGNKIYFHCNRKDLCKLQDVIYTFTADSFNPYDCTVCMPVLSFIRWSLKRTV